MNKIKELKSRLRRLEGQRSWAFAMKDYGLVLYYSSEIESLNQIIKNKSEISHKSN